MGKNEITIVDKWDSTNGIAFIQKHLFPEDATNDDMNYCLSVAKNLDLNPITKEIFFITRRSWSNLEGKYVKATQPMVSRDGLVKKAHETRLFDGIESETKLKKIQKLVDNQWIEEVDLVAIAKVYKKGCSHPFVVEVAFSEYAQKKTNEDGYTVFWETKKLTMLKKVAEAQALRKAFDIRGVYIPEELGVGEINMNNEFVQDPELNLNDTEQVPTVDVSIIEDSKEQEILFTEIQALKEIGLNAEVKDEFIKVLGNTYGKNNTLKDLGYKFFPTKKVWCKKFKV